MLKEDRTVAEIASEYEIHPTVINNWRREAVENLAEIFEDKRKKQDDRGQKDLTDRLYKQIGQQKVELDFLQEACDKLGLKPGKDA